MYAVDQAAATSTISISRAGGLVKITEDAIVSDSPINTLRTLDPLTFSTLSYVVTTPGADERVDITDAGATHREDAKTTTFPRAVAGPSIALDFLAGPYVALPAMLGATTAGAFNAYCPCFTGFIVTPATVVHPTEARPKDVPSSDAGAAIVLDGDAVTFWYDPGTFVLRELDVPSTRIKIVLQ